MPSKFADAFSSLTQAGGTPSPNSFLVTAIDDGFENWFVGIDDEQRPSVLVRSGSPTGRRPPSIKLENLDVQFHMPCKIESPNIGMMDAKCSVMRLNSADTAVRDVFFSVCDSIALMLGNSPSDTELFKAMRRLAEIFRKMLLPPTRRLSGLFGELCLIYRARLPHEVIRDWREDDADRYDFSSNELKVEVKSASTRQRVHEFSYEQCSPPAGSLGLVASLFVERAGRGTSIKALQELIEARIAGRAGSILKLREVIATTLGHELRGAETALFDLTLAANSIKFFDLNEIPAIRSELPSGISRVRFASDLSSARLIDVDALSNSEPSVAGYSKDPSQNR